MGNWHISIRGVGCHHNGKPAIDADLAAKAFVETLKQQGHTINDATITYGGAENLRPMPAAPSHAGGSVPEQLELDLSP